MTKHNAVAPSKRPQAWMAACLVGASLAMSNAIAQMPAAAARDIVDLDAVMKKGLELQKAKLESQIQNERTKAAGPAQNLGVTSPVPTSSSTASGGAQGVASAKDLRVVGIYGVGEHLIAHVLINGARVPVRTGSELEGWRVQSIDERSVYLQARSPSKSGTNVRLWLHTDRMPDDVLRDASSRSPGMLATGSGTASMGMPLPMPPLPRPQGMVPAGSGAAR